MEHIGILIGLIALAVLLLLIVGLYFIYNNRVIALRKEAEAQLRKIEAVYDKMWKVISQKANIASEYKKSFREIYNEIIAGRYAKDSGNLMKWITEANPEFDSSVFRDLMNTVEVLRGEFQHAQERMLDIRREHATLIRTYPGRWFVSDKTPIEYEVVSSTQTKRMMNGRIEDDIELFGRE